MTANDPESVVQEACRRLKSLLQRMSEVREIVPWLPPGQSFSELRRTAARLRSGAIQLADPGISPDLVAEMIEEAILQEMLIKAAANDAIEYGRLRRELRELSEAGHTRHAVHLFHRLKKLPEASDPDSPTAKRVRAIHRARRKELGRPRRKRRSDPD